MKICVVAAKSILKHLDKLQRLKYEKQYNLRLDFNKVGKVTIYAEFPKHMGLKEKRLGEWSELTLPLAREKAQELAKYGLKAESIHQLLDLHEKDLWGKVQRTKRSQNSYKTYCCRIKQLKEAFEPREIFSDITYSRLIEVLDN